MAAPGETRGRSKLFTRFYVCSSKKRRPAESYRDNRERKLFRITDERQGSFRNDFVLLLERSYTGAKLRHPPEATKCDSKHCEIANIDTRRRGSGGGGKRVEEDDEEEKDDPSGNVRRTETA
ncbi:hypothetical protein HZH66_010008 [Vespula vulgaris]|uniref:Uncharacterized protein n=1 Tax=Vespula vulgaris TaxID=7454 RepID=A0A834JJT5_VESVU|nr:hypothetical protein HZH66_010008 [Vespula vulgaris]